MHIPYYVASLQHACGKRLCRSGLSWKSSDMTMRKNNIYFAAAVGLVMILLLVITNTHHQVHIFNTAPDGRDTLMKEENVEVQKEEVQKIRIPMKEEVQKIRNRVDMCLEATNVSHEFKKAGYDTAARDHAEQLIKTLRTIIPRTFSSKYYSPCWETDFQVSMNGTDLVKSKVGNTTFLSKSMIYKWGGNFGFLQKAQNRTFKSNVVCLPKIFQMGVAKSGTTFLYCLMTDGLGMNPAQLRKEQHWWERWPETDPGPPHPSHTPQPENIPVNLLHYAHAYKMITAGNHNVVTVDGSPNYLQDIPRYYQGEPPVNYCLLPAIIPEVLPDSKFVITLRNPVKRIYASFLYTCQSHSMGNRGPDIFHERIMIKLNQFDKCLKHSSLDWCALNITYDIYSLELPCGRTRIELSMYYIHIRRWLSGVSPERFLFLTMEEVSQNTEAVGKELWDFMGYPGKFKGVSVLPCQARHNRNRHRSDPQLQIRKDTEQILKNFFQPYNQMLADLLGDKKFLWEDS